MTNFQLKQKCKKTITMYLYNLGASEGLEWPPKIHTLPTTNQTAKKQSKAILKWSTNPFSLHIKKHLHSEIPFTTYLVIIDAFTTK